MKVVLVSTYELGRQPFGLASPAAWLRRAGSAVTCLDLSVQRLDEEALRQADLIAFYLPMHTATRIAIHVLARVRQLNPAAHLCAYGLYAPVNAAFLCNLGVGTILGGEFEEGLLSLVRRLSRGTPTQPVATGTPYAPLAVQPPEEKSPSPVQARQPEPMVSLAKQSFLVPDRSDLPALSRYAHLVMPDGSHRTVGYTEASRGCKHLCRHCPVVPVYDGRFRIVQPEIVLEDIRRQVAMGAEHITFGDPDFFNGPRHALRIVETMHREHPQLTYDITTKVEHLLKHAEHLPVLRDTGCAFVTTAVESLDDRVLGLLAKGHTRADFFAMVDLLREVGLPVQPTFVAFTPWTTLEGYEDLLATLARLNLIENVASIQLAIRLLVPAGSRLLELPDAGEIIGAFDEAALSYRWDHPDPRVDDLQREVESVVEEATGNGGDRCTIFLEVWERLHRSMGRPVVRLPPVPAARPWATIPYLSEPWYC